MAIGPWLAQRDDAPRQSSGSARGPRSDPRPAEGAPVLIVDDDRSILETLSDLLRTEGYPVVTAGDGAEGLEMATKARPSLVLLDMRMAGMDGWGFARGMRERGLRFPVLVMTAASDARRWAEEIGADGYIAKPFDVEELLRLVDRYRERRH